MINDERAAEGVDHLQSAALELIQAARAFLDVAEDLVHDRDRVAEVVATAATLADVVAPDWAARRARPASRSSATGDAHDVPTTDDVPTTGGPTDADPTSTRRSPTGAKPTDRVQRIRLS